MMMRNKCNIFPPLYSIEQFYFSLLALIDRRIDWRKNLSFSLFQICNRNIHRTAIYGDSNSEYFFFFFLSLFLFPFFKDFWLALQERKPIESVLVLYSNVTLPHEHVIVSISMLIQIIPLVII